MPAADSDRISLCRLRDDACHILLSDRTIFQSNEAQPGGAAMDFVPELVLLQPLCKRRVPQKYTILAGAGMRGYAGSLRLPHALLFPGRAADGLLQK